MLHDALPGGIRFGKELGLPGQRPEDGIRGGNRICMSIYGN